MIKTDIIIVGAGPVGLFAIFEAGLMKLKCHLIDAIPQAVGQSAVDTAATGPRSRAPSAHVATASCTPITTPHAVRLKADDADAYTHARLPLVALASKTTYKHNTPHHSPAIRTWRALGE